jgi:HEAT repeat protein
MTARLLFTLALLAGPAAGQRLDARVAAAPDGTVRLSYAARPGVYGNGRNVIAWDCRGGRGGRGRCQQQVEGNFSDLTDDDWRSTCDSGPVRLSLTVQRGEVRRLRLYVGGRWATSSSGATVTDLGTVSTRDATDFLLALAARADGEAAEHAIFPATLADSVTVWPALLKFARDERVARRVRRQAVFWLGQAAGEAATRELAGLVDDSAVDREVKEQAVFALSQRPREEGVPALIRIARAHRDREVRRKAIFWLGQSDDPRALALFEELLAKP